MLFCTNLAGDVCHLALFQVQVKGTSWTSLLFSPTTSALSAAPLHGFSSNRYHSSPAVAGTLLLCSSEAMQDSADAAVPVQSLPFLGCISLLCEGRRSFPQAQRAHPGHGPPAHLQIPSAKCCFEVKFLLCFPSVPLPANSSCFIAFLCNQLFCSPGKNCLPSPSLPLPPLPSRSDATLPPITVFC